MEGGREAGRQGRGSLNRVGLRPREESREEEREERRA